MEGIELELDGGEEPAETIINLPADKTLREQLERKLAEYRERQAAIDKKVGGGAPEQNEPFLAGARDAHYKTAVLERLLQEGAVNSEALRAQMRIEDGEAFSEEAFDNAIGVVDGYANGKALKGGTGLK